jgi:hypothetical protein
MEGLFMNDMSIPAGNDSSGNIGSGPEPSTDSSARAQSASQKAKPVIATKEECLAALTKIPGLLIIGLITPQVANAMRGPYKDILEHHRRAQQVPAQGGMANDDLLEIVRKNPEYLGMLSDLLTEEQIQLVLKQTTNEPQ